MQAGSKLTDRLPLPLFDMTGGSCTTSFAGYRGRMQAPPYPRWTASADPLTHWAELWFPNLIWALLARCILGSVYPRSQRLNERTPSSVAGGPARTRGIRVY